MIIFKTYEGFFDFLKKKEQPNKEYYDKIEHFLETEDEDSIKDIFIDEGLVFKDINFYLISETTKFLIFKHGSEGHHDPHHMIRSIERTNQMDVKFLIEVDLPIISNENLDKKIEKIKDVCDIIQSIFDFEKMDISYLRHTLKIVDRDDNEVPHNTTAYFKIKFNF